MKSIVKRIEFLYGCKSCRESCEGCWVNAILKVIEEARLLNYDEITEGCVCLELRDDLGSRYGYVKISGVSEEYLNASELGGTRILARKYYNKLWRCWTAWPEAGTDVPWEDIFEELEEWEEPYE